MKEVIEMNKKKLRVSTNAIKLGNATEKADLYLDYLVTKIKKDTGTCYLEVNEKGEIILHQQKPPE
jgi:hypothetical protein